MRPGPARKKSLYLEGFRKNQHYKRWDRGEEKQFYEQILKPYDGTSSDEDEEPPKADLDEKSGEKLYVHKGVIHYGKRGPKHDVSFIKVSDLPIEHKVLARSGYVELTPLEKSFIARLSKFIRTIRLSITEGSFDCVTHLTSKDKKAKPVHMRGDRPFPYYPSSKGNEVFTLKTSLKLKDDDGKTVEAKIVDFAGFSDGSSGSSASATMVGEYIYLACDSDGSDGSEDACDDITLYVSNSGKLSENYGYGRDLCFTTQGCVTTLSYKRYLCVRQGEPLLIALNGSTVHTTYHQRQIIHRLLSKENLSVDLEDYEGTEVHVLCRNEERFSWSVCSRIKKLSKAIRRGVMGGKFKSTLELADALFIENQDLIVVLRQGMCGEHVKGAVCFGSTVDRDDDAVIELKKGAYVEEGAWWFRVCSGGILLVVDREVHWAKVRQSGDVYHVEVDTLSTEEVGDGDYELLPYGKTLDAGSYIGGLC